LLYNKFRKSRDGFIGYVDFDYTSDLDKRGGLSWVIFSPLVVILIAKNQVCRLLLLCLLQMLNIWLFIKLVKNLFI
jgi:hypothetical protein